MLIGDYLIEFARENKEVGEQVYRTTYCYIWSKDGDKENLLAVGDAICSPYDRFSRKIGRKLSLTRAINNLKKKYDLPKEERTFIWIEYFKLIPGDKT